VAGRSSSFKGTTMKSFDKAIKELRDVIKMPDQKHWNYVEMRERAMEDWVARWFTTLEREQLVMNQKKMTSEYEDYLKEKLFHEMLDQIMEENSVITKENNKIIGELVCLRRNPK
jgi:hypothetical protein